MANRRSSLISCGVVAAALVSAVGLRALADEDDDADEALRSGAVVPVKELLVEIRRGFEGRILTVELDQEWRIGGRIWVYEAKVLTPQGEVLELEYDARSLELIEVQRPKIRRVAPGGGDR